MRPNLDRPSFAIPAFASGPLSPRLFVILLLPLLLAGCGAAAAIDVPILAGVAVGSVVIFHRTPVDMLVSVATGRDCSVVHLDKGDWYCRPRERPPERPEFCTRSLGTPDCWSNPENVRPRQREIADGPRTLTPDQEAERTSWWPWVW